MKRLHTLYQSFLKYPYLNACLVFEDHYFQGILLKKDLERTLSQTQQDIKKHITKVPIEHLEELIFNQPPTLTMSIPYINQQGELTGSLLYDEFVSEFFPEDFATKLSLHEVFRYYENPLIILNQFKTILYMNQEGENLLSKKAFGIKVSEVLLAFEMKAEGQQIVLTRKGESWNLMISKSNSPYAPYYLYQFFPKEYE